MSPYLTVLLASALLACCLGNPPSVDPIADCEPHCQSNPEGRDSRILRTRYGGLQLYDGKTFPLYPDIDGELAIWQISVHQETAPGNAGSEIFAVNLTTRQLIGVATEPETLQIVGHASAGRVVYTAKPWSGSSDGFGPARLMLWSEATRVAKSIETGLQGEHTAEALEGEWLLFRVLYGPDMSRDGLWAINIVDGRKVMVRANNETGTVQFMGVGNAKAYMAVGERDEESAQNVTRVISIDLESGEEKILQETHTDGFNRFAVAGDSVVWEEGTTTRFGDTTSRLWHIDAKTGQANVITNESLERSPYMPAVGGGWVVYSLGQGVNQCIALDLGSMTKHIIVPSDTAIDCMDVKATDGKNLVVRILKKDPQLFEVAWDTLAVFPLPRG